MDKYTISNYKKKGVKVYNNKPTGWEVTSGTTTEPRGYVWINNKESRFSGKRKSALLKK